MCRRYEGEDSSSYDSFGSQWCSFSKFGDWERMDSTYALRSEVLKKRELRY